MSKSKKTVDERYQESIKEDEAQVAAEEAQRGDVSVTVNGDAVYVPTAPAQADAPEKKPRKDESKAQRFKRLASRRLPKAVKTIGQLATLAAKGQYESSDTQRKFVLNSLYAAVDKVQEAFNGMKPIGAAPEFPD